MNNNNQSNKSRNTQNTNTQISSTTKKVYKGTSVKNKKHKKKSIINSKIKIIACAGVIATSLFISPLHSTSINNVKANIAESVSDTLDTTTKAINPNLSNIEQIIDSPEVISYLGLSKDNVNELSKLKETAQTLKRDKITDNLDRAEVLSLYNNTYSLYMSILKEKVSNEFDVPMSDIKIMSYGNLDCFLFIDGTPIEIPENFKIYISNIGDMVDTRENYDSHTESIILSRANSYLNSIEDLALSKVSCKEKLNLNPFSKEVNYKIQEENVKKKIVNNDDALDKVLEDYYDSKQSFSKSTDDDDAR